MPIHPHKRKKAWHSAKKGQHIAEELPLGFVKPKRGPNFQKKRKK
jgi:hypothetical protein